MMERKLDESRCQETVYPKEQWGAFHGQQCKRKTWQDGWCRVHHPDTAEARRVETQKRLAEKWNNSPQMQLVRAAERMATLERLLSCPKHDYSHPLTYVLLCLDEEQITFAKACEAIQELAQGKAPVLPEGVCRTSGEPVTP